MKKNVLLVFVSVTLLSAILPFTKESTSFLETTIYVDPSTSYVSVGNTFVIDIVIADVYDLIGFGFCLGYNNTILEFLSVWITPGFVAPPGYIAYPSGFPDDYIYVEAVSPMPASGSGAFASITFNAKAAGSSILDLYYTKLCDPAGNPIPHTIIDGSVTVSSLIITVPDDYPTIQEAINAASDEDTIFVRADTYYEHVVVNKSLSLVGESRESTIIDGSNTGTVVYVTANTVAVEGFTIRNGGIVAIGIHLAASNNSVIQRNVIKENGVGIIVDRSNSCQISGNIAKDSDFGIFVVNSRNCTVSDNTVSARAIDIDLQNSSYCVVINNTANCYGHGIYLSDSPNCVVSDNTAVKTSGISDGNCITLDNSDNCIVSGNTANKNTYGIFLAGSSNVTISNNTANNNKSGGIELEKSFGFHEPQEPSKNCTIVNNIAINNDVGIFLSSSQHSIVRNNIANNNWWWGIAILSVSNNCIISGNTVNNNPWGSIIVGSYECKFSNNTLSNNEHGLELAECSDNHIYNNNLINNTNQVFLRETYNNTLYHNNFINSTSQVYDWAWDNQEISLSINTWDNGYPSGGNYWSAYNDTDSDNDGIGGTPYIIDENNQDNYPLMGIFSSFNTSLGYNVNVISNSTIKDFHYFESNSTIKLTVSNMTANQTHGYCRLMIPHDLLSPPYNVIINDTLVPYTTVFENETLSIIYFSYEHSTLEIIVIPEFPTWISMLLLLMVLTVAIAIYKRRLLKTPIH